MIRDDDIEKILKKMVQDMFKLSDEEMSKIQFHTNFDRIPFGMSNQPLQADVDPFDEKPPLVEIYSYDDKYSILIEVSGYSEENIFINIREEKGILNLILGLQDASGRMHFRRTQLPDDATEIFEREMRGSVVELTVQKAK